ncbi:AraC family transcriptional regulator [Paenibacillus yanchengensis]|uniref:AraC family transcriptional regulator n=1 Tax=Paenibacillus yanchengensis TaxID=2035833 RepID=A0ABW4YJ15_9BACL
MNNHILSIFFGQYINKTVALHHHSHWQLEIIIDGSVQSNVEQNNYTLYPGDMLLLPPYVKHNFVYHCPDVKWITLKFERDWHDRPHWSGVITRNDTTAKLITAFQTVVERVDVSPYERAFTAGILEALFEYVHTELLHTNRNAEQAFFDEITTFITSKAAQPLTVQEIAEHFGYTRSHLSVKFKQISGYSMKHHIDQLRIQHIKQLLRYTEFSISTIAIQLGFADLFSFSRFFKKHTQLSPREFIQQHK